ncbi:MAG TPA: ABC transporter permease, partial [Micromonosporaceae bacterium]
SHLILSLAGTHARLTATSVIIAVIVAVPLGVIAYWFRPLAGPIIALSNGFYTIPSLALFAILAPFTGILGSTTLVIVLTLYALTLIVYNTVTGLRQVPPEVLDAATGMGYGRFGRLMHVELPLALPSIMTGIRLATVSTVALVTIGVLTGNGGFGQMLIEGLSNNFYKPEVMTGTLACVALGLILDLLLFGVTRLVTPWMRREAAR